MEREIFFVVISTTYKLIVNVCRNALIYEGEPGSLADSVTIRYFYPTCSSPPRVYY